MGNEIPADWLTLDPLKFYKIEVQAYAYFPNPPSCTGTTDPIIGCSPGVQIIDFINTDKQCTEFALLGPPVNIANRLLNVIEEFDTFAECDASL